jgi:hypothetical protein
VEQTSNAIRVGATDRDLNALLEGIPEGERPFTRHFSQGEDFFLLLEREFVVPQFPIHHDVRDPKPPARYIERLRAVIEQVIALAPQILRELAYYFDPTDILRPCFYRLFRIEESVYLFLVRLDLTMRPATSTVIERGTNDLTPNYRSRRLFVENCVVPLAAVAKEDGRVTGFQVRQTISQTWIGEQGRGYFVQGIWMDADLTKFFSKLFLPAGKRIYPYFPFLCKYKTVCHSAIRLSPESRSLIVPLMHRALQFLLPALERIQAEMKNETFSEAMPVFRDLKERVPVAWYEPWKNIRMEAYLNDVEAKEYRVDD